MQSNYRLQVPQNVVAGLGSIHCLGEMLEDHKAHHVTLMTDKGVLSSGMLELVSPIVAAAGAVLQVVSDVPTEPEAGQVLRIYEEMARWQTDLILAVGGGSVMDTAKMVAVLLKNPDYAVDLTAKEAIRSPGVPTVMVPTSAGTGAEATPNSIVVLPEKKLKVGVVHPAFLPQNVILDPQLARSLPPAVTAATGLDAFCHCIETYISKKACPFSRLFSLKGLELICKYLRRAYHDGQDMEAREGMLLAAFYGGVAITASSTVAVHALSYPLGGSYRIPHGISNAILLPYVMEYNMDAILPEIAPLAVAMGLPEQSGEAAGKAMVSEIFALAKELGIPESLTSFGIGEEDLAPLAQAASQVHRLLDQNPKPMPVEDILELYRKLV